MVVTRSNVVIDNVNKRFGSVRALSDISISIDPGEFATFLGPSGCGKTTLLRMIGGFGEPDEGRILIGGDVVNNVPPNRRNCGFVFQSYALFPHMTVAENITYGLRLRKDDRQKISRRLDEMLALVNLTAMADRYPSQMSGGQQQRVAMARAIAPEPRVLLLDEPLSALDAKLREHIRFELRALQKRLGTTTVFVTHDQEEAMAVSDRIVVMNSGRVEQIGTPAEIYASPATPFVASFVGVNNFIPGQVTNVEGGRFVIDTPIGQLEAKRGRFECKDVTLSIRPEHALIVDPAAAGAVEGTIRLVAYLGSKTRFEVACPNGIVLQIEETGLDARYKEGDSVGVRLPSEALYALPAERA